MFFRKVSTITSKNAKFLNRKPKHKAFLFETVCSGHCWSGMSYNTLSVKVSTEHAPADPARDSSERDVTLDSKELRTCLWLKFRKFIIWTIISYCVVFPTIVYVIPFVTRNLFFLHFDLQYSVYYGMLKLIIFLIFDFSKEILTRHVRNPYANYVNLTANGIESVGHNFYIDVSSPKNQSHSMDAVRLGVWHILPAALSNRLHEEPGYDPLKPPDGAKLKALLNSGTEPVVVYLHGNSYDRTNEYRCKMYNVLSKMQYHVLVIDYRGYGDSSGNPSEDGLVRDAHAICQYARRLAPSKTIVVWGHSMGTGVATRLVAELSDVGLEPEALVLESPFNNLYDVIRSHQYARFIRWIPWFNAIFIDPLIRGGLVMNSDERITRIKCPILVLHAADDSVISVKLARKLVNAARAANRTIQYEEFSSKYEFNHKLIYRYEGLLPLVTNFVDMAVKVKHSTMQPAVASRSLKYPFF